MLDAEYVCAAGATRSSGESGAGSVPSEQELLGQPARFAEIHPLLEATLDLLTARPDPR
jgi:hypothetical protein